MDNRRKKYGDAEIYEKKLGKVMGRLGASSYDFNYDRYRAWVQFRYKNQLYMFEHSVDNPVARSKGVSVAYGSDAFAQIVLALEDLARMVERGIYDLSTWIVGMKSLPPASTVSPAFPQGPQIPECFRILGFDSMPRDPDEVKVKYRELAKAIHPDRGGSDEMFSRVNKAYAEALERLKDGT